MKIGFALIPSEPFFSQFISIQNQLCDRFQSHGVSEIQNKLGKGWNLPHMTLVQGDMDYHIPYERIADQLANLYQEMPFELQEDCLEYLPRGWYFYCMQNHRDLRYLHSASLALCYRYLTLSDVEPQLQNAAIDHLSEAEIRGLEHFGYRYSGQAFLPHITIARTHVREENQALVQAMRTEFQVLPKQWDPDRLTVYEMGGNGTHRRTLYSRDLQSTKKETES